MSLRGRGRARRQIPVESGAHNVGDDVEQHSIPMHRRARQVDEEVDLLVSRVDEMELVMARFQKMNPKTFSRVEYSDDAESWLIHIEGGLGCGRSCTRCSSSSQGAQPSQPAQVSKQSSQPYQQSGGRRFGPHGKQFKRRPGSSSSGSSSSSSGSPRTAFCSQCEENICRRSASGFKAFITSTDSLDTLLECVRWLVLSILLPHRRDYMGASSTSSST
ncbi:hypothetical protein F511_18214 [Dorcoceras hygrometricum]|uniref:Uncharacterized protein n=1 Tax=Dorcoceras hygrometricum TaxID=472368 RepID=A0A2Z7BM79_9LAMI|nr:hypothetical protein F511_18214 [Dorcoceras hygrometricum]